MTETIRPAPIHVADEAIADLRERLARTRFPERETVGDWSQGVPVEEMRKLVGSWANEHDWRRCERMLNEWDPSVATIDGLDVHFFHIRSPEPDALPLVMTHGWPGSPVEFHKVIAPLVDPRRHGGNPSDAVHLVLPSLPGYGFSGRPVETGWTVDRIADAWSGLMHRLGYGNRWAAQGGDWGAGVSQAIAAKRPAGCIGIHLNFVFVEPSDANDPEARRAREKHEHYDSELAGYNHEQSTRPQTIGMALADSPAGQAAWIYEKFNDWTDNGGRGPEGVLSRDEMLDNISVYWFTNSGASSARLYWERAHSGDEATAVTLPVAVSLFPHEIHGATRREVERAFPRLVYWGEPERGGHFAAFEVPELFVEEVRSGLAAVRRADAG